ncbi:hypothetical protein EYF80_019328 [Liparis tanakae]|uniref:Uncharacterized protein n=1 Tax=Liparis tanakae TaxID=230148 RepID=A0A4Z2HY05_9TELE|nr:hypothetical protein EYF80_019328 [Liparis tanakae]
MCTLVYEEQKAASGAVSQCWLSRALTGAGGEAVGRPEPCTMQASFRRSDHWGKTPHAIREVAHMCVSAITRCAACVMLSDGIKEVNATVVSVSSDAVLPLKQLPPQRASGQRGL